jgi:HSP20 family protein
MFEYRSLLDRPFGDPFGFNDLFRGLDRVLRETERDPGLGSFGNAPARLREDNDRFVLSVEVPGMADKDIKVNLEDGVLTVSAERTVTPPEGFAARRRERPALRFSRSFALGDRIDPEKTTAELKDGILTVSVGKAESVQKRSIAVKSA